MNCGIFSVLFFMHVSYLYSLKPRLSQFRTNRFVNKAISEPEVYPFDLLSHSEQENRLYEMFLEELSASELTTRTRDDFVDDLISNTKLKIMSSREIIEVKTNLVPGLPVEIVNKNRVMFGNILAVKSKSTVSVVLSNGETVTVDIGQVISCWDYLEDELPRNPNDWTKVSSSAMQHMKDFASAVSIMDDFWSRLEHRDCKLSTDSLDLGIFLFQRRNFDRWINPTLSKETHVSALTAAERYVAAILLYNDDLHFKRRMSRVTESENEDESFNDEIHIIEGGYQVHRECVVKQKQIKDFIDFHNTLQRKDDKELDQDKKMDKTKHISPFRLAHIPTLTRALELYALATKMTPPSSVVKNLLKQLSKPLTPAGASSVLSSLNKTPSSTSAKSAGIEQPRISPWPASILQSAVELSEEVTKRRQIYANEPVANVGKKGKLGLKDFRGSSRENPMLCIDRRNTKFSDDAFSLSPATGEILIHIANVMGTLSRYENLWNIAKDRTFSTYTPQGPSHMLPPVAIDALKLSQELPNEVLTVAISVDASTGDLIGFRIFPSLIGPVISISEDVADFIIDEDIEEDVRFPKNAITNLKLCWKLMDRILQRNPWICDVYRTRAEYRYDKRIGTYQRQRKDASPANILVDSLLTLYSNSSCIFCKDNDINVPIAFEDRDRSFDSKIVKRFATKPLRHWLAQVSLYFRCCAYIVLTTAVSGTTKPNPCRTE
jgi:hypothetical protein